MEATAALLGVTYCVVSLVLFVLNGFLLKVLLQHSNYKTSTYRIIKHICVVCMLQLVPFFVGGLMTLSNTVFHYYVDRVFGVLVQPGWFLYLALSLTLAIDRLVIFVLPKRSIFKDKITNCLLVASWMFCFVNIAILCLPGFGFTYATEAYYLVLWTKTDGAGAIMMSRFEAYFDLIILAIILLIYLIVFGYLIKTKISSLAHSRSFLVEMRIFLVAVISFCYESMCAVICFWLPPFTDDKRVKGIFINMAWLVDCGLFAIVTLVINASLRKKLLALVVTRKRSSTVEMMT